jgi:hypothetical protein
MDVFTYLPKYRLFTCRLCEYVVSPEHIDRHVRKLQIHRVRHHQNRVEEFRAFFQGYPDRIQDISDVVAPQEPVPIVPQLAVHKQRFRCQIQPRRCHHICSTLRKIQDHCRKQHLWTGERKKGRPRKGEIVGLNPQPKAPWKIVSSQRLFSGGPKSQYFEVISDAEPAPPPPYPIINDPLAKRKQIIKEKIEAAAKKEKQVIKESSRTNVSSWLDMVGWIPHLQHYDHKELLPLIELPLNDPDIDGDRNQRPSQRPRPRGEEAPTEESIEEQVLQVICTYFNQIISVGQHTVIKKVNWFIRFEINKKEKNKPERRPFNARLLDDTMQRYRRVWKQLICYIVRSVQQQQR